MVAEIERVYAGRARPPLLLGGRGDRMLTFAAEGDTHPPQPLLRNLDVAFGPAATLDGAVAAFGASDATKAALGALMLRVPEAA
ncbi:hypothetical protein VA596_24425 [Amycolatopsis sp., V23-08]|uniref:Uncharacterized protein n=1 Tax=Amycolatopsis heterodermiae TaxID=3110235 RepID=A0ABU5RAQ6_9PSEU|nr:hypothetical protein [Amycolatopsis sp., V23-08]MEA5362704.1 hypothetical protein [Amycolatopsis sp., V23-08]